MDIFKLVLYHNCSDYQDDRGGKLKRNQTNTEGGAFRSLGQIAPENLDRSERREKKGRVYSAEKSNDHQNATQTEEKYRVLKNVELEFLAGEFVKKWHGKINKDHCEYYGN